MYHEVTYVSYCKEFEIFLADFLEFAIQNDKKYILYHLAKIVNNKKNAYFKERRKIREYFLKASVDATVIAVSSLECFKSLEFDFKIIDSDIENVLDYIEDMPLDNVNDFLAKLFKRPVYSQDIRFLARGLQDMSKLEKIIHFVINAVNDKRVKSECLYAILEEKKNFMHHEYLVQEIINLNVFETLKKLLALLNQDEVHKYMKKVFSSDNMNKILNFALILQNEDFIRRVIEQGSISEVGYLVINLETEELDKILEQILTKRGTGFYTEVVILLEGVLSVKYIQALKFIANNDVWQSFNENELTVLGSFAEKTAYYKQGYLSR